MNYPVVWYNSNVPGEQYVTADWIRENTSLNPDVDPPSVLAAAGYYLLVVEDETSYDSNLYTLSQDGNIVGTNYVISWVLTPVALPDAKTYATSKEQESAAESVTAISTASGFSESILTATAALVPASQPAEIKAVLDAQNAVVTELVATIAAIEAATTVDEINNIVNKPTGTLFTGRGAAGPEDLNVSYYTAFNSTTLTEADTELYVPSTDITISYGSGGSGQFDSSGDCFNPGDYLIQIRETKTSMVIAEFEVPLNPAGEDVAF